LKRIISVLICMIMLTGTVTAALKGDIDADGKITVSDALGALRIAASLEEYSIAADADGDGNVTVADALELLRCCLGFITPEGIGADTEIEFKVPKDAAKNLGLNRAIIDRAIVSAGDPSRVVNVMRKAQAGEDITIGFIGGSVTVGGAATTFEARYARVVYNWWADNFPNSDVGYVNAGFSGTPSLFAVHRLEEHLMYAEPDVVVIEFGVNDELQAWQQEAYASLVRRILTDDCQPAVLLFFVMNNMGNCAQADQVPIGEFYDLPMVSYRDAIWPEVEKGTYIWDDICADYVHPTNKGHAICGNLINAYFEGVYNNIDKLSSEIKPVREDLPLPYTYENTHWYHKGNYTPVGMGGFKETTSGIASWENIGDSADPLIMRVYGKRIVLPILQGESAFINATVTVDGGTPISLSKDNLLISAVQMAYYMVYDSDTPKWHTVEITRLAGTMSVCGLYLSW